MVARNDDILNLLGCVLSLQVLLLVLVYGTAQRLFCVVYDEVYDKLKLYNRRLERVKEV